MRHFSFRFLRARAYGSEREGNFVIGRKRGVYICMPMCASARVASSNIVYLGYGYRSTRISVLNTEIGL